MNRFLSLFQSIFCIAWEEFKWLLNRFRHGIKHTCIIRAYDEKKRLIAIRIVKGKLLTKWFLHFAVGVHGMYTGDSVSVTGEGYITVTWADTHDFTNRKIAIGTGTTEPAYTDTGLVAKKAENTDITYTVTDSYIEAVSAILLTVGADISEAGLFIWNNVSGSQVWGLMMRDVFTPVPIPADGSISIVGRVEI